MSKRNVSYIKPKEPAFLSRLKQEIGYKEGPTVDTKREKLEDWRSSDESDGEDQPTVVVLKPGDLTSEEAAQHKLEKESEPADLTKRVVFKKPGTTKTSSDNSNKTSTSSDSGQTAGGSNSNDNGTNRSLKRSVGGANGGTGDKRNKKQRTVQGAGGEKKETGKKKGVGCLSFGGDEEEEDL